MGDWGEIRYHHRLSCGHVEIRRRPVKSEVMGCSSCSTEQRLSKKVFLLDERPSSEQDYDALSAEFAQAEIMSVRIRGAIAARLGVVLEDVDVLISDVDGRFAIASASVHIDGQTAMQIFKNWSNGE
jgi:hypothetical protein